jgi:type II secretory pathway predicted ATPase ExeA
MAARLTKLPARRTALKGKRQHWGRRLDKFRVKYNLSERDLVEVIGDALKKSAVHNLLSGQTNPRLDSVIKTTIAARLRIWLRQKKRMREVQIESEMLAIFHETTCQEDQEVESVLTQRTRLTPEAQKYFGLRRDPFTGDPQTCKDVFTTPHFEKIVSQCEDAVNYQHFIAVLGDSGGGKRNLTRLLEKACDESDGKMRVIWPDFPNMEVVNSGSICSVILKEYEERVPHDRLLRVRRVKKLLESLSDQGKRVALGFDECHRLDPRLLTALKNFYEMGSGGFVRYLGLILLGQPKFRNTLNLPEFREITERIDVIQLAFENKKTPNLGRYTWDYVAHRLKIAGAEADRLFDREVVNRLASFANGNTPQALGNLCNAALNQAFEIKVLNDASPKLRKVHMGVLKANEDLKRALEQGEPKVRAARHS